MDDFNAELNRVLRYSMEPVANMIQQLASDSHRHTRWGHPEGDHTFRLVLADALQESNREKEAHLLRTEGQHVLVDGDGRIRPANFTHRHVVAAARQYADHLDNGIDNNPLHNIGLDEDYYRPEDFSEPLEPLGKGEVRVIHPDMSGTEYHNYTNVHHSELGNHFADHINSEVDITDTEPEYQDTADELERRLRTAPYEEVDLGHSSERDNGFGFAMRHDEL